MEKVIACIILFLLGLTTGIAIGVLSIYLKWSFDIIFFSLTIVTLVLLIYLSTYND